MRIVGLLFSVLAASPAYAACVAESGSGTAALVELYTSAHCSGCRLAERWLAGLRERHAPEKLLPLALHVRSGEYLGSKDAYPQRKLLPRQRIALVYTPQILLQGRDFPGWASNAFDEAAARINARPAAARIKLEIRRLTDRGMELQASAEVLHRDTDAALYLAAYRRNPESGPDYVVLEWLGPLPLPGRGAERRTLALVPGATPANSGAAAFVQDRRSGEVLQALLRSTC